MRKHQVQPRVTLKDIAKELDMCFTSVSRILRGDSRFSARTVRKVQDKAMELNYRPNVLARTLASQGSTFVGVITPDVHVSYSPLLISGIQSVLEPYNYNVVLGTSRYTLKLEKQHLGVMADKFVEGVIIAPCTIDDENSAKINMLTELRIPVVTLGIEKEGVNAINVRVDHESGGRMVGKHLTDIGHKTFVYLTHNLNDITDPYAFMTDNKQRYDGFSQVLESKGLKENCTLIDAHGGEGVTAEVAKLILKANPKPTAVFCFSDLYAAQLLREFNKLGVKVPEDISIVGYDDMPIAELTTPGLTTVQQPKEELGRVAASKLKEIMDERPAVSSVLQPKLVVRESTAPPKSRE